MVVTHLDMDAFYASVERNRKDWDGPIVVCVYSGRSKDSGAVSTCSYDARELGIKAGMPIKTAKKIAEEADLEVLFPAMDKGYYRGVSDSIKDELLQDFRSVEQASIDEFYIEIGTDYESAERRMEKLKNEVKQSFGLTCSVGIAENKLIAKIASDRNKPDGITVVRPEGSRDFMKSLELEDIHGIGAGTVEKLKDLGITSVKELAEADASKLVREFGENQGLKLKKLANGEDDSKVEESEQKQYTRIITLEENSDDSVYISSKFGQLAEEVVEKAKEDGKAFSTVSLIVIDDGLEMYTRSKSLKSPVQDEKTVEDKGKQLLEEFLDDFDEQTRRVGLRISNLSDFSDQSSLGDF